VEVTLTKDIENYIQEKVNSGQYASANEVFLASIKLLKEIEKTYQGRFEELRNEVRIGLEAAERGDVIDSDQVFNRLAAILAESKALEPQTDEVENYAPQTALGQQFWSIRQHAVAAGMPLQSAEAIAEEIGAERKRF
jgi:antitoxin ParD1/3/4